MSTNGGHQSRDVVLPGLDVRFELVALERGGGDGTNADDFAVVREGEAEGEEVVHGRKVHSVLVVTRASLSQVHLDYDSQSHLLETPNEHGYPRAKPRC